MSEDRNKGVTVTSKLKYQRPTIKTEALTTVAAVCNGQVSGGRKASTGAPNFCQTAKLKS